MHHGQEQLQSFVVRVLNIPEPGKYLLGGYTGYVRSIKDYKILLDKVAIYKDYSDYNNGRKLCTLLAKQEFSKEELRTKNVTGYSRDHNHKLIQIPTLDANVLNAIFVQVRHQFPGFKEDWKDSKARSVKGLNKICRVERTSWLKHERLETLPQ